jgi:predicted nucleotidyltransferase/predicted dehydrogenase
MNTPATFPPQVAAEVREHRYPLLFVTISGAHLYGFPSPDSDFDLRGVHILPAQDLLGLETPKETIESSHIRDGVEIDLVTHDARKFFLLLLKKNGYVLEQLLSPLIVLTTPHHAELKSLIPSLVTKHHAHHYLGFAQTQWHLFEKGRPRRVKPLLYVYRVLLTGIHLMQTGQVEANLLHLNDLYRLPQIPDLVARKLAGPEQSTLPEGDFAFHEREYQRLRAQLEEAMQDTHLPEAPPLAPLCTTSSFAFAPIRSTQRLPPHNENMTSHPTPFPLSRRRFVQASAALAALPGVYAAAQPAAKAPELTVAVVGVGSEGRNLVLSALKIPGIRFVAVADIWAYALKYAANLLKKYDQNVAVYADYADLLAKEKGLDCIIVATPDWMHSPITVAALEAGKHVYCEKEMSNTLEGARAMIAAQRKTGKLLQIGHQRRSEPRYHQALQLIEKDQVLGRLTHFSGQWNRPRLLELGWPKGEEMSPANLKKYGYDTMDRLRNWRWYKKYGGGALADLGSHQIDVFTWFLRANPSAVIASGGLDYYTANKEREWYDNVFAIFDYPTPPGLVRGIYQVLNTTSYGGYYEVFMGDQGSLEISEDPRRGAIFRELGAPRRDWENEAERVERMGKEAIELKIGETLRASGKENEAQRLIDESNKPPHQLHLENFFAAVRANDAKMLNCPPEVGYQTTVAVMGANDAVARARRVEFGRGEFEG